MPRKRILAAALVAAPHPRILGGPTQIKRWAWVPAFR
jgi:hypothetical protein